MRPRIAQVLACVAVFALSARLAQAQSVVTGTVTDTSGAVLPGVTVEASSPALIERVRTAVSDTSGHYRIVDLRPGTYKVAFRLPGFTELNRDGIELPGEFTLTLNAEMRVGGVEETLTVSGQSPVVDVQSTAKTEVMTQQELATLPTGRSMFSVAQLIVGITLSNRDVGGSRSVQQAYIAIHGLPQTQNTIEIDGINSSHAFLGGANPQYIPEAFIQESVYQTSSNGADVTGGGVRVNLIPRDGGNHFNGSAFISGFPGQWVSSNVTPALTRAGLGQSNKVDKAANFEGAIGGPIKRDRLWFFGDVHYSILNSFVAGTYECAGCYGKPTAPSSGPLGLDSQYLAPTYARLTWQVSPRNKLAWYGDWAFKARDGMMTPGTDPNSARSDYVWHATYVTSAKWTSPVTNKLLVEAGVSGNMLKTTAGPVAEFGGRTLERGSPEWFATPIKTDINLGTTWNAPVERGFDPKRYYSKGSVSYVTGAHNLKTGAIYDFGYGGGWETRNGDLVQRYRNAVPDSVQVFSTPTRSKSLYKLFALFVQDTWAMKRLTLTPGVRWEYLRGENPADTLPAGRFVGVRPFPRVDNLPNWKTISPRFGAAYDLFGNAKTAVKFSVNRYDFQTLYQFADRYHPAQAAGDSGTGTTTAILSWTDLNGDDLAQGPAGCLYLSPGCEINFQQLAANFGVRSLNTPDPNLDRPYYLQSSIGVQHELLPKVSVALSWLRADYRNQTATTNTLLGAGDFAPVTVASPLDGHSFTVYNLNRAKLGQVANFDATDPNKKQTFDTIEFNLNARLPHGATLAGGSQTDRTRLKTCTQKDDPNTQLFCDDTASGLPWLTTFKMYGTYPLPWGVQVSGVFNSFSPLFLPGSGTTSWLISPATRYAANCVGACTPGALVIPNMTVASLTIPLTPRNTQTLDRTNQFDLGLARVFRIRHVELRGRLDAFNAFNGSAIQTVRSASFGTAAFRQPATILDGRTIRAGVQIFF
jgi:hypothetical protein